MADDTNPEFDPEETLIAPLSQMIASVGDSIVQASTQLEQTQLDHFRNYPEELKQAGVMPAFYHMQAVEVELKLALHITGSGETTKTEYGESGWIRAAPVNAEYTETRNFDVNGSSRLTMTFAPAPPPPGLTEAEDE